MNRTLLSLLCFLVVASCTKPEQDPDLAGQLIGTYSTTQIKFTYQNYEGPQYSASEGQITMTRAGGSLDQVNLSFSYKLSQQDTTFTKRNTETETIQLQATGGQIHFKGLSPTNLGWYLGSLSDQNGNISGRYRDILFVAVKQ